jgi:Spy/CpxP family protein refolding chaperone
MRTTALRRLAAGFLLLALAASLSAQSSFAWWKSEEFQKDLGLTGDQCARIDSVFQATLPKLREGRTELDREEATLSQLIDQNVDEAQIAKQVDLVEATRARLNKLRTLMLFRMRQVLTPEQRTKFTPLHDKWIKDHPRKGSDGHDAHK